MRTLIWVMVLVLISTQAFVPWYSQVPTWEEYQGTVIIPQQINAEDFAQISGTNYGFFQNSLGVYREYNSTFFPLGSSENPIVSTYWSAETLLGITENGELVRLESYDDAMYSDAYFASTGRYFGASILDNLSFLDCDVDLNLVLSLPQGGPSRLTFEQREFVFGGHGRGDLHYYYAVGFEMSPGIEQLCEQYLAQTIPYQINGVNIALIVDRARG